MDQYINKVMSKINIIHILPVIKIGGGIKVAQNIISNCPSEIKNQVWANGIEDKISFAGSKIELTNHAKIINFPKILNKLVKENKETSLIHVHGRNGFFVFLAAKILKMKVVYHPHGYYYKLLKKKKLSMLNNLVDYLILQFSDLIIFCSESEKNFAIQNYSLKNNHIVIHNVVEKFKKNTRIIKQREKTNIIYCLATNNIHQKGIDLQLSLAKELLDLMSNFKFIHYFNCKNHKEMKIIENKIKELGLSNHYFLKGTKTDVWNDIDCKIGTFISTSRFEGQPLVIHEAFQNGIPVVATNCIGQKELLTNNNSFILDIANKNNWSRILFDAINSENKRSQKRKAAKDWIRESGDIKSYMKELLNAYKLTINLNKKTK